MYAHRTCETCVHTVSGALRFPLALARVRRQLCAWRAQLSSEGAHYLVKAHDTAVQGVGTVALGQLIRLHGLRACVGCVGAQRTPPFHHLLLHLGLWLSIPSGFLVLFEKPNRNSFTFTPQPSPHKGSVRQRHGPAPVVLEKPNRSSFTVTAQHPPHHPG